VNDTYSATVTIRTVKNGLESVTTRSTDFEGWNVAALIVRAIVDHFDCAAAKHIGEQVVEEAKERMARE
jgi:hypothetical protein